MRLIATCMTCFREDGHPSENVQKVEYNDSGLYEVTCDRGHKTVVVNQDLRFQVLFEIGANAILDGYYREAIASFSSSLERFFEFCLRVIMSESSGLHEEAWTHVAAQSERQLGAFVFAWATSFGRVPRMQTRRSVEFRNKVIHKGKLPTIGEATDYGEEVFEMIKDLLRDLQRRYPKGVAEVALTELRARVKETTDPITTVAMPMIVSLNSEMAASLRDALEILPSKIGRRN